MAVFRCKNVPPCRGCTAGWAARPSSTTHGSRSDRMHAAPPRLSRVRSFIRRRRASWRWASASASAVVSHGHASMPACGPAGSNRRSTAPSGRCLAPTSIRISIGGAAGLNARRAHRVWTCASDPKGRSSLAACVLMLLQLQPHSPSHRRHHHAADDDRTGSRQRRSSSRPPCGRAPRPRPAPRPRARLPPAQPAQPGPAAAPAAARPHQPPATPTTYIYIHHHGPPARGDPAAAGARAARGADGAPARKGAGGRGARGRARDGAGRGGARRRGLGHGAEGPGAARSPGGGGSGGGEGRGFGVPVPAQLPHGAAHPLPRAAGQGGMYICAYVCVLALHWGEKKPTHPRPSIPPDTPPCHRCGPRCGPRSST